MATENRQKRLAAIDSEADSSSSVINVRKVNPNWVHDQTIELNNKERVLTFLVLSVVQCVSFMDQTGIAVLLSSIADDFNAQSSIGWAGIAALTANTACQPLYGRLSELFGRKIIYLFCICCLAVGALGCALSTNPPMLFASRTCAGIGNGGLSTLTTIMVSDFVPLHRRGKYQGITAAMVGLGSGIGPVMAATLVDSKGAFWEAYYWFILGLTMLVMPLVWKLVPSNPPKQSIRQAAKQIDWYGMISLTAAIIMLLIPISNGGHTGMPWSSATPKILLTAGSVCLITFVFIERKARYPVVPLAMFHQPRLCCMLVQTLLLGISYQAFVYFLPLYLQNVLHRTPLASAILLIPLYAMQALGNIASGMYTNWSQRIGETIWLGFVLWTIGAGILITANEHTPLFGLLGPLCIVGLGVGFTFSSTLVALQAIAGKEQRAYVTANRNFLRACGGAISLAASSTLLKSGLTSSLPATLDYVADAAFASPKLAEFSVNDQRSIVTGYVEASRRVFIFATVAIAICLPLCLAMKHMTLTKLTVEHVELAVV